MYVITLPLTFLIMVARHSQSNSTQPALQVPGLLGVTSLSLRPDKRHLSREEPPFETGS
ncbi:hypothetical protein HMPREF9622_01957 [Cutibacterium modestum HL037PA3]|nr:hypothetical protein HMPREF9622_01957 [Cutibacterium modestum HL037PA3]